MAIPDFQTVMLPRLASDGAEHKLRDATHTLEDEFGLSEDERGALLPSRSQTVIHNRVAWASTYMRKAALLESTRRGYFKITSRGLQVLAVKPAKISVADLNKYPEFVEFHEAGRRSSASSPDPVEEAQIEKQTPEELLESAVDRLRAELAADLIAKVKSCPPEFFERLVVTLLLKMGYGGARAEAGRAIGKSGDGGIDGIIDEDRLGLDSIYIQAKRWQDPVGRPEIQKFVGALQLHRARKGVFITTSSFSSEALDYVGRIDNRVVLIDGRRLAELMIDFGVGVSPVATHEIKRIDNDFFADE
jgi:restriction system protein